MPIREEEADRRRKGNRPFVSLVIRQVEEECIHTKDCKFWQETRKKMDWWKPQGKKGEVPSDQKGKAQSKPDEASSSRPRAAPA